MRELESLLAEAQNAIGLLSDDNEALLHKVKLYEQDESSADRADVKAAQQAAQRERRPEQQQTEWPEKSDVVRCGAAAKWMWPT